MIYSFWFDFYDNKKQSRLRKTHLFLKKVSLSISAALPTKLKKLKMLVMINNNKIDNASSSLFVVVFLKIHSNFVFFLSYIQGLHQ